MKYALGLLGVVAATTLLLVSAAMNWRFGFMLGKSELDSQIYGAASAAADGLKALLPFFIMWAVRQRSMMQALAGVLVWTICTAYSLTSSLGFSAENRASTLGERTLKADALTDLRGELKRAKEKLAWVPRHRSAGTVQAELDSKLQKTIRVRRRNKSVSELTEDCSASNYHARKYCPAILDLRKELAIAVDAQQQEAQVAELREKLSTFTADNAASAATGGDPQVALISKLTGVNGADVQTALIVLVAMLVELGSGLGFFVVLGDKSTRRKEKKAKVAAATAVVAQAPIAVPVTATPVQVPHQTANDNNAGVTMITQDTAPITVEEDDASDELRKYYAESIEKSDGSSITASKLYENYCAWAESQNKEPMTLPAFGRQFSEIGIQKAKIAGRIRYIGVKLVANSEKGAFNTSVPKAAAM